MPRFVLPLVLVVAACADRTPTVSVPAPEEPVAIEFTEPVVVVPTHDTGAAVPEPSVPIAATEPSPEPKPVEFATYELRRGESLAHFARWSGVPIEVIAESSGLDLSGSYPVGTEIRVPVDEDGAALVETRRAVHQSARVDGYLASRGGSIGTGFHTVKSGETAWSIADTNQGIPVWMLEAYNPSVDLDHLRPGQDLMVPVLADTVVADEGE